MRRVALDEHFVAKLAQMHGERVEASRRLTDSKTILTHEELQARQREAEEADRMRAEASARGGAPADEDEDEAIVSNPLNLPLGWDGQPIPVWLYKLHGLGEEFKCEICGNESYWGRRAFDRHFQERRHARGMRCLGIPNTKHFHDITRIDDAVALYASIRGRLEKSAGATAGGDGEEFEDSEGNVLSKRMYDDLARQGLL